MIIELVHKKSISFKYAEFFLLLSNSFKIRFNLLIYLIENSSYF